jgi:transcriptional regulator with XRE-family HTH domain
MTLGRRVQQRREALGLSQVELAREAGITQGLLSRIENGHTPNPGAQALKGLALALRCSIDYLVGLYDNHLHNASPHTVGLPTF